MFVTPQEHNLVQLQLYKNQIKINTNLMKSLNSNYTFGNDIFLFM